MKLLIKNFVFCTLDSSFDTSNIFSYLSIYILIRKMNSILNYQINNPEKCIMIPKTNQNQ